MKRYGTVAAMVLTLLPACFAQRVLVPAYSTVRVTALAKAIGAAEGFGIRSTKPTRKHNPGDLKENGGYRVFRTDADGWAALQAQVVRIVEGRSKIYKLNMTINRMGQLYASSPLWARNVAKQLRVPGTTKLSDILCGGELDNPPVLEFN